MDRLIGENAGRARVEKGLSQEAVAEGMRERNAEHRWSQATVWSVEKGDRALKASEILDLCRVLGTGTLIFTHPDRVGPAIVDMNHRKGDLRTALVTFLAGMEEVNSSAGRLRSFLGHLADRNGSSSRSINEAGIKRVDAFTREEWSRVETYIKGCEELLQLAENLDGAIGEGLRATSRQIKGLDNG